jgi:hypothetical protein
MQTNLKRTLTRIAAILSRRIDRPATILSRVIILILIGIFIGQEFPPPGEPATQIARAVGDQGFDFVQWEGDGLAEKITQVGVPIQNYLDEQQQVQFVLDYMDRTHQWLVLENKISNLYATVPVTESAAATLDLRSQRDELRNQIEQQRPTVESILQQQVASVLSDQGFAVGGEVLPPVAARISPLPYILIISARDNINRLDSIGLQTGLNVDQAEYLETKVLSDTNQSALVVPIGGLAAYPAMILETSDLTWLLQTISHEWTHNWLYLRPLGYSYLADDNGEIRTINETTASIVGDEVGLQVMRRYYLDRLKHDHPDLVEPQPLVIPTPDGSPAPNRSSDPNQFNFSATMHATRIHVDALLADARSLEAQNQLDQANTKISKAEQYMEQQRQLINSHGYRIRKINQAYFAFYGAYADQPGASGSDTVGPNVIAMRVYSPNLRAFLDRMSTILTLDQLKQAVEELKP